MRLAIVGSRTITDRSEVERALSKCPWYPPKEYGYDRFDGMFVSGGADGVDTSIELIAEDRDHDIEVIEPDYSDWSGPEHPAKRRNTRIVEESDAVVAVWDGNSNGTRDTIDKALDRGKPLYVHIRDNNEY